MKLSNENAVGQKTTDEKYMLRCLQLAKNALGMAAPNPMVGCVVVHKDLIIGEGYTSPYGGAHAEVNAIYAVKDTSLLSESTIYVTLEPCAHHGKTPPCVDLILKHAIPEIVIGLKDPHSKVAGRGIQKLKDAGRSVRLGVLEAACRAHHRRFLSYHEKKRPYIILKWAQSFDGFIAPETSERKKEVSPYWITNERSRQVVHKWRSEEQAILVGTTTVILDNPSLNTRHWKGKAPIRIFLDKDLRVPDEFRVLDGTIKTIVITQTSRKEGGKNIVYEVIDFEGDVVRQIIAILYKYHIISLIVEGGARTLEAFISSGLWDEARIFTASHKLKKGLKAPKVGGTTKVERQLLEDQLKIIVND